MPKGVGLLLKQKNDLMEDVNDLIVYLKQSIDILTTMQINCYLSKKQVETLEEIKKFLIYIEGK